VAVPAQPEDAAAELDGVPDFDDNLRAGLEHEAWMFFDSIRVEDRNVMDLMNADYTFVNERVAKHYGIPNVYGSRWRKVTLTDEARRGLLGKAAILTVTSNADRTSPVKRGKWVLDNIFNAPPPPPPPVGTAVPRRFHARRPCAAGPRTARGTPQEPGVRQLPQAVRPDWSGARELRRHRASGGRSRAAPAARRSTPRASCRTGTKIDGVVSLRRALVKDPQLFVSTVVEKLMTYGLGRGMTAYDMPTVRAIVRQTAASDYKFSSIVIGIVRSPQFTMRLKAAPAATTVAAR
jgi:hypothetical protein